MQESVLKKMMTNIHQKNPYLVALEWHIAQGVDEGISDVPVDRTAAKTMAVVQENHAALPSKSTVVEMGGTSQMVEAAEKLAQSCQSLDELRTAILAFDGLAIKKTAMTVVFADGNPASRIMLVGEAPNSDEDKAGKPFVGDVGVLMDKILASIGLSRTAEDSKNAVYMTNFLNWRPPGNRTPSPSEIEISRPFIERHIALIKPDLLIICGGLGGKALLGSGDSLTKLRGKFHDYTPSSKNSSAIPSIVTYHPDHLIRNPLQKRAVWADMLMVAERLK